MSGNLTAQLVEPVPFHFACPLCQQPLQRVAAATYLCSRDGQHYACVDGIWRFLPPPLAGEYDDFIHSYETVRRAEGWDEAGSEDYRSLPFSYGSGRYRDVWRVRVGSYRTLMAQIVAPLARARNKPLRALDLGAGTGWLSYRLALAGHASAAVDLITNAWDGLGAWQHYAPRPLFLPVQAAFDHLPFATGESDLVIFNGAIHYARDYPTTLKEALRVLRPGGQLVIMDSPYYARSASGLQMVQEKDLEFRQTYGLDDGLLPAEHFLTPERLAALSSTLGIRWRTIRPFRGIRWMLRSWRHWLGSGRQPARFPMIVGEL